MKTIAVHITYRMIKPGLINQYVDALEADLGSDIRICTIEPEYEASGKCRSTVTRSPK